jgi:hypothetical protein
MTEEAIDTTLIELDNGKLWVKYRVIPPPEDEEYLDHEVIEIRLDSEEGCPATWLYTEFEEVQQLVDDRITTELN